MFFTAVERDGAVSGKRLDANDGRICGRLTPCEPNDAAVKPDEIQGAGKHCLRASFTRVHIFHLRFSSRDVQLT